LVERISPHSDELLNTMQPSKEGQRCVMKVFTTKSEVKDEFLREVLSYNEFKNHEWNSSNVKCFDDGFIRFIPKIDYQTVS